MSSFLGNQQTIVSSLSMSYSPRLFSTPALSTSPSMNSETLNALPRKVSIVSDNVIVQRFTKFKEWGFSVSSKLFNRKYIFKHRAMDDDFADEPIVISLQLKNP
jgi:hypothetical protein